jgi:hypothetical protein
VGIGQRVRAAHLSHFCPGALGFPVKSPNSAGLDLDEAWFIKQSSLTIEDHMACVSGETCARCGQPIAAGQDARRRLGGEWVHESCPARRGLGDRGRGLHHQQVPDQPQGTGSPGKAPEPSPSANSTPATSSG